MSNKKLSKQNYDKLNENYLYSKEPEGDGDVFWSKNWTFKVKKCDDGNAYMLDTFFSSFNSHCIQVTNQNINDFKFIFDFDDVCQISDYSADEYNEDDIFRVATDSGGYNCGRLYWIKKNAKKSKIKLKIKIERKIEGLKNQLEYYLKQQEELKNESTN